MIVLKKCDRCFPNKIKKLHYVLRVFKTVRVKVMCLSCRHISSRDYKVELLEVINN